MKGEWIMSSEHPVQSVPIQETPIAVLLVEDDPDAAELVRVHLSQQNSPSFSIEWCDRLDSATRRIALPGIEVVLLDLTLPNTTGSQTLRCFRKSLPSTVPIVIYSADDSKKSKDLIWACPYVKAYLIKDKTSPAELRQVITDVVRDKRSS
jgi:DNA-binding response OmpR family regulator